MNHFQRSIEKCTILVRSHTKVKYKASLVTKIQPPFNYLPLYDYRLRGLDELTEATFAALMFSSFS